MNNLKNKTILMTGIQSLHINIGSNFRDMAFELAKHNQVIWVDKSPEWKGTSVDKSIGAKEFPFQVFYPSKKLLPSNFVPFKWLHKVLIQYNSKVFQIELKEYLKQFPPIDVWICDSDMFRSINLQNILPDSCTSVMYYRDYLMGVPFWSKYGVPYEEQMAKQADLVATNSLFLRDYFKKLNPESYFIGQGSPEITQFDVEEEILQEMQQFHRPIIGYVGFLTTKRLDIALIADIAKGLPDYSLVLIGPEDEDFKQSELHQIENVHFLGRKDPETLYQYIQKFDVCINPQKVNSITEGNYPRKVDEYLKIGKPTVVTATSTMELFHPYVYLAKTSSDYIDKIQKALQERCEELELGRRKFANRHSWAKSLEMLELGMNKTQGLW